MWGDKVRGPRFLHVGSLPVFPDWRALDSFLRERMGLFLLLCVGRSQDCWVPTVGSINDVCQDEAE